MFFSRTRNRFFPIRVDTERKMAIWDLRRRFLVVFGLKTDRRRLLFRCFFKNGDFVKIVLPLWWERHFQGSDRPKIDPGSNFERYRQQKTTKIATGAVSRRTFSLVGSFFVDFGLPAGPQTCQTNAPGRHEIYFWAVLFWFFFVFFARVYSGRIPNQFWRFRGPSRTTFPQILSYFFADAAGNLS